jgi:actin-related protein 3
MNPPENRESLAEIFFETFNVPGLFIGVQAVFALMGCNTTFSQDSGKKKKKKEGDVNTPDLNEDQINAINSLTGIVVDSGDGVTHVVPICDGYVLGSNIKHIPIAGRRITKFMMEMIKERGEPINTEDLYLATMDIKEKHGYLARDIVEEYSKFDQKDFDDLSKTYSLSSKFKKYTG